MAGTIFPLNSGRQIASELKSYSGDFDCADPNVAFTDGSYQTDVVIKNKALIVGFFIKYYQDLSLYPVGPVITVRLNTGFLGIMNTEVLPVANIPDNFAVSNTNFFFNVPVPGNSPILVNLLGVTGSGITALSFTYTIIVVEFDN